MFVFSSTFSLTDAVYIPASQNFAECSHGLTYKWSEGWGMTLFFHYQLRLFKQFHYVDLFSSIMIELDYCTTNVSHMRSSSCCFMVVFPFMFLFFLFFSFLFFFPSLSIGFGRMGVELGLVRGLEPVSSTKNPPHNSTHPFTHWTRSQWLFCYLCYNHIIKVTIVRGSIWLISLELNKSRCVSLLQSLLWEHHCVSYSCRLWREMLFI